LWFCTVRFLPFFYFLGPSVPFYLGCSMGKCKRGGNYLTGARLLRAHPPMGMSRVSLTALHIMIGPQS
jgi:hypothetical protein